jgi:hypothetical protein
MTCPPSFTATLVLEIIGDGESAILQQPPSVLCGYLDAYPSVDLIVLRDRPDGEAYSFTSGLLRCLASMEAEDQEPEAA